MLSRTMVFAIGVFSPLLGLLVLMTDLIYKFEMPMEDLGVAVPTLACGGVLIGPCLLFISWRRARHRALAATAAAALFAVLVALGGAKMIARLTWRSRCLVGEESACSASVWVNQEHDAPPSPHCL